MKNQIFKIVFVGFIALCFFSTAYAAVLNVDVNVNVPPSCTVTDTDGVTHNYTANSSSSYLAICALDAAVKNSSISGTQLSNQYPEYGLFVAGINDTTSDSGHYWAIYQNTSFADLGVTSLPVVVGDTIVFQLTDSSNPSYPPPLDPTLNQVTLHIHSLTATSMSSGGGPLLTYTAPAVVTTAPQAPAIVAPAIVTPPTPAPAALAKPNFDIKKAFDFLIAQQKSDGSFGEELYTDWTALALASGNNQDQTIKLIKYFGETKTSGTLLTDYERHTMALMSVGLNPYDTNGENYIGKIISGYDGKQFGDVNQDNDDIFALIVLQNAGYSQADKMINDDISFVLSAQNKNGSWDNSVDMTGAAIEALSNFSPNPGLGEGLKKAENFLKQNQKDNGGWNDNASSTAWALEGILALNEKPEDWIKNNNTPFDYLATIQDTDGGAKDLPANGGAGASMNNKIWETAYVVSALSGKTWNQIMQSFEKLTVEKVVTQNPSVPIVSPVIPVPTSEVPTVKVSMTQSPKPKKGISTRIPATSNAAAVINAVTESPAPATTQQLPKKNWFLRLLDNIFGN